MRRRISLVVHFDLDHEVDVESGFAQRFGLRDVAREAVDDEAFGRIGLLHALFHELDHERIGHERAAVHVVLGFFAERRSRP